jgi:CRP-like cAMP-binding protein
MDLGAWGSEHAMATDLTTRNEPRQAAVHPVALESAKRKPPPVPATIGTNACTLRLRAGQDAGLSFDGGEVVLIVRSGVLTLNVALPGRPRQAVALYFPDDAIWSRLAPIQADATVTAATNAELWRIRFGVFEELAARDQATARFFHDSLARQAARQALHSATLSQLNGEERVATFLVELALRAGVKSSGGAAFDVPLSRRELALYIGLNADTLSRITSRLRSAGLISRSERNRIVVRDVRELMRLTPAAGSLAEMF